MKHLPNSITTLRIIGAIFLFIIEPLSASFYILYSVCGFTDVIDGFIARKFHLTSELGTKLDSIADLIFYGAMILNIFPYIFENISVYLWIFPILILIARIISYIYAAIKYHRFASLHTYGNKISGLAVFCIPYLIQYIHETAVCVIVSIICALATIDELLIHIKQTQYNPNVKSYLFLNIKKEEA